MCWFTGADQVDWFMGQIELLFDVVVGRGSIGVENRAWCDHVVDELEDLQLSVPRVDLSHPNPAEAFGVKSFNSDHDLGLVPEPF